MTAGVVLRYTMSRSKHCDRCADWLGFSLRGVALRRSLSRYITSLEKKEVHVLSMHWMLNHWCKDIKRNVQFRESKNIYIYRCCFRFSVSFINSQDNQQIIKMYLYKLHNRFRQDAHKRRAGQTRLRRKKTGSKFGSNWCFLFFFLIVILVRLHVLNSNQ